MTIRNTYKDIYQFTSSPWFGPICSILSDSWTEFTEQSQLLIVKFVGAYILAAHAASVPALPDQMLNLLSLAMVTLQKTGDYNNRIGPVLRSCIYSLIAHRNSG